MITSIFFDLDGTLIDSKKDIVVSVNEIRKDISLPPLDEKTIISFVGIGTHYLLRNVIPNNYDSELFYDKFIEYYKKNSLEYSKLYDGVPELLEKLSSYKKALITNKSYQVTMEIVKKFNWQNTFEIVYGGDSLPERKPSPYPILKAMEELNLKKEEVLFFGDSSPDYISSRDAGVKFAFAKYGYEEKHKNFENSFLVEKPLDLLNFL